MKSRGIYELAISILGMCQNIVRNKELFTGILQSDVVFESQACGSLRYTGLIIIVMLCMAPSEIVVVFLKVLRQN